MGEVQEQAAGDLVNEEPAHLFAGMVVPDIEEEGKVQVKVERGAPLVLQPSVFRAARRRAPASRAHHA